MGSDGVTHWVVWLLVAAATAAGAVGVAMAPPIPRSRRPTALVARRPDTAGRSAADHDPVTDLPLVADLLVAALRSGVAPPVALDAVADVCGGSMAGDLRSLARCLSAGDDDAVATLMVSVAAVPLRDALAFAGRTGAAVTPAVAEAAAVARRLRRDAATRAAGRLSAALVLPLGLGALPGFLLLGVAPVVVRLVTSLG
jgi:Flp pilus assembly protein TadB